MSGKDQNIPLVIPDEKQRPRASELLKPESWPTPKWFLEKRVWKIQTYEEYYVFELRARYIELENDFRSVLGNFPNLPDIVTAARISEILHSARENLEQETPSLLAISSCLNLVSRYMVWIYPEWMVKARIDGILPRLSSLPTSQRESRVKKLTALSGSGKENYGGELRSVLDDTIGAPFQIRSATGQHRRDGGVSGGGKGRGQGL